MNNTDVKEIKPNTLKKINTSLDKQKRRISLSYIDRFNEGEDASDLFDELLDPFQSRIKKTERSLKYYLEKCVEDESTVQNVKKQFNTPNKASVKIDAVKTILKNIKGLKEKFEEELKRRCITEKEYGERIRATLDLTCEYNNCKESVNLLKHIFLENSN